MLGSATYRSLGEQRLSPKEERFEKGRRTVGLFLAPLLAVVMLVLPLDIPREQQVLAAVLLGVIALWITEAVPIPIGGLLGVAVAVFLGVAPVDDVLGPFGSSTIFTFIGAFILAQAMLKHALARRFAFRILSLPRAGGSTTGVILAFGAITALLSAFVSNTATVAMLLPTAMGILGVIAKMMQRRGDVEPDFDPRRLRVGTALMLMLLLALILIRLNKPEISRIEGVEEYVAGEREKLGKLTRAEKNTLIAFGVTVTLWLLPGIFALVTGTDSTTYEFVSDRLDEGVVAVFGASLLFLLPTDWPQREFTLRWRDASEIDWGTIILFGTGIIFGSLISSTGLAETIGTSVDDALGLSSVVPITIFAVLLAIIVSETTSNTASAAVVVPIVIPVAVAAGVNPFVPASAATFAASFGFMLPVSTPQNAIVDGSGVVPITKMIRSGITFDIAGAILIILLLPIMVGLLGLGS
ncbi:SLC13 family permease [Mycobacterium sp. IDR2000157661]|uniref:SLC13 family permease n=1 Tax=Mycobacterium sp. IDR2000157661 TaxID=2867005 RepID=UPI00351CF6F3